MKFLACLLLLTSLRADEKSVITWLEGQKKIDSIQATFVQERFLSRVTRPLRSDGVFYFQRPHLLRWEVGSPPRSIIVADEDEKLTILDTKTNEARSYTREDVKQGRAPAAAGFLAGGVPDSWEELSRVFEVEDVKADSAGRLEFVSFSLRDRKAAAFVLRVEFTIHGATGLLQRVALKMRDGSRYVTTFANQHVGAKLSGALFRP